MPIDVTQIIEPARNALAPAGASLSEAWSAVIGDRITAWRLKNAAAIQIKVNAEIGKLGLKLDRSKIPERYAFAWFEEATKQDEPEIQELFARLLARAVAGDEDAADRRHLEILTRLTPMDAKVMEWLFENPREPGREQPTWDDYASWKELRDHFGPASSISIEHLVTLGVLERTYSFKRDHSRDYVSRDVMSAVEDGFELATELTATETGASLDRALSLRDSNRAG